MKLINKAVTYESAIDGESLYIREAVPRINPEYRLIAGALFNLASADEICIRRINGDCSIRAELHSKGEHYAVWQVALQEISTWLTHHYYALTIERQSGEKMVVFYQGNYDVDRIPKVDQIF